VSSSIRPLNGAIFLKELCMEFVKKNRTRAKKKLKTLEFDPMDKLVSMYQRLDAEDRFWTELRSNKLKGIDVIQLNDEGKPVSKLRYSSVAHTTVLGQQIDVASKLLPYAYDKDEVSGSDIPRVEINLT
jgi:hypothetical protein